MSHPPPDWDKIDPYSDLEEEASNSGEVTTTPSELPNLGHKQTTVSDTDTSTKTLQHSYNFREHKHTSVKWTSGRQTRIINTYLDSIENSDDSDYEPKRWRRSAISNPGLREPSSAHI